MRDEPEKIESASIPGLYTIRPPLSTDKRGMFVEAHSDVWGLERENGSLLSFVEDDYSVNRKNVLRGLHGDDRTWKLVSCVYGTCYVVVVDRRPPITDARWESFELSGAVPTLILIPSGCATGFLSLQEGTIFTYKQSERYQGARTQFSLRWNDPAFSISWPVEDPILSERDRMAPLLSG